MNHSVPSGDFTVALTAASKMEHHGTTGQHAHLGGQLVHKRYRLRRAWNAGVAGVSGAIAHLRLPDAPARATRHTPTASAG